MSWRLISMLVLTTTALTVAHPTHGSCAGPSIEVVGRDEVRRPVLTPGSEVTVQGRSFADGCNDTGGGSACFPWDQEEGEETVPMTDVELVLRQGARAWELGSVDAGTADENRLGWTEWTFTVPAGARTGRAALDASGTRLEVRVRR